MNVHRKVRRFVAKLLRSMSAKIEPLAVYNELSTLKRYRPNVSQDASNIILIENDHTIILRKASSDVMVFEQIFFHEEYADLVNVIQLNKIPIKTVVDLGANIGLATIYLHNYFPDATFICVEPYEPNFELLKVNLLGLPSAVLCQKAVWSSRKNIYLNKNFRDGKEWAVSTSDDKLGACAEVDTITIDEIIQDNDLNEIDLLKIDIEGAEIELFKTYKKSSFLNKTKVVAIEIHDEFDGRDAILSQLASHNFLIFESKQTLIAINAIYIQNSNTNNLNAHNHSIT